MVHKHELHELTMSKTLSKASGLIFKFIDFCLSGMLANIHAVTNVISFRVIIEKLLCSVSFARQYIFFGCVLVTFSLLHGAKEWSYDL